MRFTSRYEITSRHTNMLEITYKQTYKRTWDYIPANLTLQADMTEVVSATMSSEHHLLAERSEMLKES